MFVFFCTPRSTLALWLLLTVFAWVQEKERAVLRLLGSRREVAELEGDLVFHLDFKRFALIKALLSWSNDGRSTFCVCVLTCCSDNLGPVCPRAGLLLT